MVRRAHQHELLGVKRRQLEVGVANRTAQADLHLIAKHQVDDVLRVTGAD